MASNCPALTAPGYASIATGAFIKDHGIFTSLEWYDKASDKLRYFFDEETGVILDEIKALGFHYAAKSGITIAMNDIKVPDNKPEMLKEAEQRIAVIEDQYHHGLITEDERYNGVIGKWLETTDDIEKFLKELRERLATAINAGQRIQIR